MDKQSEYIGIREGVDRTPQTGYTLIELLGVMGIVIIVILMTQGMWTNYKRFSIEETASQRLKELARVENIYRNANDPTVNPEAVYGNFFDLQNAGLVPDLFEQSDVRRHTVNAYVPHYRLEFVRSLEEDKLEPDQFQYMIQAFPLTNSLGLKTFYVQEDGEVYFYHYLWITPR